MSERDAGCGAPIGLECEKRASRRNALRRVGCARRSETCDDAEDNTPTPSQPTGAEETFENGACGSRTGVMTV